MDCQRSGVFGWNLFDPETTGSDVENILCYTHVGSKVTLVLFGGVGRAPFTLLIVDLAYGDDSTFLELVYGFLSDLLRAVGVLVDGGLTGPVW